jgi:hypothetical protein
LYIEVSMRVTTVCSVFISVLAMALTMGFLASEDVEAQIPAIDVSLDDGDRDQTARITDGEQDHLTFKGEVTLNRPLWPPGTTVVIEVVIEMPSLSSVWEHNIDPPEMSFASSMTQNFTATVTVPPALGAATFYNLVFNATTEDILFFSNTPDNGVVRIAQYYRISRQFSTEPLRVEQGKSIEFNITLINRGNGDDTFNLEVTNEAELDLVGLIVYFDRSKRIEAGEELLVKLRLEADQEAIEGEYQLNLTIRSEGSSSDPVADLVTSGAEWTIAVDPGLISQIKNYWYLVGIGAGVGVVGVVLLIRRRRKRAAESDDEDGDEDYDEDDDDDES